LESNPGKRILESSLNHLLADGRATKDLIAASIEKLAIDRRLLAGSGATHFHLNPWGKWVKSAFCVATNFRLSFVILVCA
jgi:hypothetical protein